MSKRADITVGQGLSWHVSRRSQAAGQPGPASPKHAFSARLMPNGAVVRELDRELHERALEAVRRKIRVAKGLA